MFGQTLLVINPVARTGKVQKSIPLIRESLEELVKHEGHQLIVRETTPVTSAKHIVQELAHMVDTVVVVGGDGVINEAVNGLMTAEYETRPALAIIPCGNGDDFARSIGMKRFPMESTAQLKGPMELKTIDLGLVNGRYFLETLSMGLDAAIAIATFDLRERTGRTGTMLYLQAGISEISRAREIYTIRFVTETGEQQEIRCHLMAIQNGKSYGGGYQICPNAKLDDGKFSICYAAAPVGARQALSLLIKAKSGRHTNHPCMHFFEASKLEIELPKNTPIQIDGEKLEGDLLQVEIVPQALRVWVPKL